MSFDISIPAAVARADAVVAALRAPLGVALDEAYDALRAGDARDNGPASIWFFASREGSNHFARVNAAKILAGVPYEWGFVASSVCLGIVIFCLCAFMLVCAVIDAKHRTQERRSLLVIAARRFSSAARTSRRRRRRAAGGRQQAAGSRQ